MRWPLVSRTAYDTLVAASTVLGANLKERTISAEARADAAEARYHELVLRVARQERLPESKVPEPPGVDFLTAAAQQQAGNDPVLMRYLLGYVAAERAKRAAGIADAKSDGELFRSVTQWEHTLSGGIDGMGVGGFWPDSEHTRDRVLNP